MKKIFTFLTQDPLYSVGLLLIAVSAAVLFITIPISHSDSTGAFFINYAISGGYLVAVFIRAVSGHKWLISKGKLIHTVILLILWFISAFALNRDMNVFDSSVAWLSVWIVVSSIAVMLAPMNSVLPKVVNYIIFFILGSALVLFTYYAIYLVPLYAISVIGIIAIGISMHTYIPLFLVIVTFVLIKRAARQNRGILYPVIAGAVLPLLICTWFLISWNSTNKQINLLINQNALNDAKVPAWITVSQHIDNSPTAERILKTGLVYTEASNDNFFWRGLPSKSFSEPRRHDPLVVLATLFFKQPNLDETDRINILKAMYHARHQAQDRLWSGDDLETISIISNVKLFPEYRMAYTEKTLTIRNNSTYMWSQQEAIYTFHLSEGSVVSSLSLWIDGKEEKSRLTTKAKADSAYKEVVGVESRDPSVVHWQEGNTVTVRVFPCTSKENRRFRIGITSPLTKQADQLIYDNASFDGPDAGSALETMLVTCAGKTSALQLPAVFKQMTPGVYRADRTYQPGWQISFEAPALAEAKFSFADTAYQVKNYAATYDQFTPSTVYLDINSAWSREQLDQVWAAVKSHPVYAYDEKLIRLDDDNIHDIYDLLHLQNFSLFPANEIKDPANALLVSASTDNTPNLNDLDGSGFAKDLTAWLKTSRHIRFYNIGSQLSPYLKALKEFRVFNYAEGTPDDLAKLLSQRRFVHDQEDENTVVLGNAQMIIQKTTAPDTLQAPDHLLRLFAYNDLMRKVGGDFFKNTYEQPANIGEAEKAYIVSPVSSMVVLETQKDYERFGIDENKNSLKNASMKSSGAAPEPQEWMLIILCLGVVAYFILNKKGLIQKFVKTC